MENQNKEAAATGSTSSNGAMFAEPAEKDGLRVGTVLGGAQHQFDVVVTKGPLLNRFGDILMKWLQRGYSEASVLAKLKTCTLGTILGLSGFTYALKVTGTGSKIGNVFIEMASTAPGTAELLWAGGALVFIVLTDVYAAVRRSETELEIVKIVSNPSTPSDVKTALIKRYLST